MIQSPMARHQFGSGHHVLIVAELSGNHHGDYANAEALVRAAAEAGANAVKTQCFTPDAMTLDSDAEPFRLTWQGQQTTLYKLYQQTAMPMEWHAPLKALAESLGLPYFASVFDQTGIDLMVSLDVPYLKIASFELTDLLLIYAAARTGKPLIISTGMGNQTEVRAAVAAADAGIRARIYSPALRVLAVPADVTLLKCTSAYPAPIEEANLRVIAANSVQHRAVSGGRDIPMGLSDHTRSNAVVAAAIALGACMVERHLTLARSEGGPDAAHSDEPAEFANMVDTIHQIELALGEADYNPTKRELPMLRFRRSWWAVQDIAAGEVLTYENIRCLRPIGGLEPGEWSNVIGKRALVAIARGTPLGWDLLE